MPKKEAQAAPAARSQEEEEQLNEAAEMLLDLARSAKSGSVKVKAIAQLSRLRGWDSPTKLEVTNLTPEERARRIAHHLRLTEPKSDVVH